MNFDFNNVVIYTKQKIARHRLEAISKLSTEKKEDDGISPAEEWLLNYLERFEIYSQQHPLHQFRKGHPGYHQLQHVFGIATTLKLFPIPERWQVRQRMLKVKYERIEMFIDDDGSLKFEDIGPRIDLFGEVKNSLAGLHGHKGTQVIFDELTCQKVIDEYNKIHSEIHSGFQTMRETVSKQMNSQMGKLMLQSFYGADNGESET